MSRNRIEKALELVYESLDLLSYLDSIEADKATDKLSRAASLLEGEFSGIDDDVDPEDDESVAQIELDFHDDR